MPTRKVLLVGAGSWAREWARLLLAHPALEVVGWVSRRAEHVAEAARSMGVPQLFTSTDLRAALKRLEPDFVVDVTPPAAHHEVTLSALAAGVPVLGEKPMADGMHEAREMVRASERAGKLYMVSQSRRYHPGLRALRKLIVEQLGTLGLLDSGFYIGAHFGGFRDQMASPLLLEMAIHTFDAARYLSQADPVSVYCEEFNPSWSWYRGNASASASFELSGGLRYTYRGSWCAEGLHTSWEGEWRAVGSEGSACWNGHAPPLAERVRERGGFHSSFDGVQASIDASAASGIAGGLADFLRALDTGEPPQGECHDNIKSLAMVFAALESARTGAARGREDLSGLDGSAPSQHAD
jgi:predicted dehydrogenase